MFIVIFINQNLFIFFMNQIKEEQGKFEDEGVYWERNELPFFHYKCLLCEDKFFTGNSTIQNRDVHMYCVH